MDNPSELCAAFIPTLQTAEIDSKKQHIKIVPNRDDVARLTGSVPINKLPNAYFQITISSVDLTRRTPKYFETFFSHPNPVSIGLEHPNGDNENFLHLRTRWSFDGNQISSSWSDRRQYYSDDEPLPSLRVGDVLGCGITTEGKIFFVKNDQIFNSYYYPSEFPELYPALWIGEGTEVSYAMCAPNPLQHGPYQSLHPKKWFEWLSEPLGMMDYQNAQTTATLESLTEELMKEILRQYEQIPFSLLLTSKSMHKLVAPSVTWTDVHAMRRGVVGYYADLHQTSRYCYGPRDLMPFVWGSAWEIKLDGSFCGRQVFMAEGSEKQRDELCTGHWFINRFEDKTYIHFSPKDLFFSLTTKTFGELQRLRVQTLPKETELSCLSRVFRSDYDYD